MLEYSDGMKFDLDTEKHVERRSDGWYVVGNRMLCPVKSEAEGLAMIDKSSRCNQNQKKETKTMSTEKQWRNGAIMSRADDSEYLKRARRVHDGV